MHNSQEIAQKIKEIAKHNKISLKIMLEECELGRNTMSSMYHGKSLSSDSLAKIADYLDCSVDYLLGRADIPCAIHTSDIDARNGTTDFIMTSSRTETTLLIEFRDLNTQGQDYILQTMDLVKDKYKKSDPISHMEEIG